MDVQRRDWLLAAGVTALALISIALPVIAPAVFLAVFVAFVVTERTQRHVTLLVAAPLMMAGFVRFLMFYAVPNIVIAGQVAAEEKAVNRLREIRWAEGQAKQLKGHYVSLRDLVEDKTLGNGTGLLNERTFHADNSAHDIFRADAYEFRLYLPQNVHSFAPVVNNSGNTGASTPLRDWTANGSDVDPSQAALEAKVYAWPAGEAHGGLRVFYIDQNDLICESGRSNYRGSENPPPYYAAASGNPQSPCSGPVATDWHPWRNKKPVAPPR